MSADCFASTPRTGDPSPSPKWTSRRWSWASDGTSEIEQAIVRPLDWDEIIARCDDALAHDAGDVSARIERGGAFLNKRDNRRTMTDYDAAIAMAPDHAEAYRGRGDACFNLGDYDPTIADCAAAVRRDPHDESAIVALVDAYIALWEQRQSA